MMTAESCHCSEPESSSDTPRPAPLGASCGLSLSRQPPVASSLIPLHWEGEIAEQMDNSDGAEGHIKFLAISSFL